MGENRIGRTLACYAATKLDSVVLSLCSEHTVLLHHSKSNLVPDVSSHSACFERYRVDQGLASRTLKASRPSRICSFAIHERRDAVHCLYDHVGRNNIGNEHFRWAVLRMKVAQERSCRRELEQDTRQASK